MDNKIAQIMTFAILTESLITYFKEFFIGSNFSFSMLFSVILGVFIAIAYKIDLLEQINLKSNISYIGNILTGILISRGSNYLYDLINKLTII